MTFDSQQIMRIKPCFYYNQIYNNTFSMNLHKHNTLEIMYVCDGLMTVEFLSAGCEKETVDVTQGQFVLIKPNLVHKVCFPQKTDTNVLNVEFECRQQLIKIENLFFLNGATEFFPQAAQLNASFRDVLIFNDTKNFLQTLLDLHKTLNFELSNEQFEIVYTFNLIRLITTLLLCDNVYSRYRGGNLYINKAMMYLQTNFHCDLVLEDVSAATGCSTAYLEQLFKTHCGMTVAKKLNELRVMRAKYLLRHFSLPIKDIGQNVGFKNTQSFINNFKIFTGLTPNEYRNKKQLEYKHIRAYEKSYFDEKFNSFITFDKGTMQIGESVDGFLADGYLNSYLFNGKEQITKKQAEAIRNRHKFVFADADAFEFDGMKVAAFVNSLNDMKLFDNFIGFYVHGTCEDVVKKVDFVYSTLSLKRILVDIDGNIPPDSVLSTATDVLLSEDNFVSAEIKNDNLIRWLKLNPSRKNNESDTHRFLKTNFGGIVFSSETEL